MLMNERVWKDFISFFAVKVTPFAMSILSLYFLASSSPNKGDVFGSEVFVCILLHKTQGERVRCISLSPLPYPVALRGISVFSIGDI